MSHHERAFDSAVAYHRHVAAGLYTTYDHLIAAALACEVAAVEEARAELATTPAERRMFAYAAQKARKTRDGHELAAEITTIGEQVSR